MAMAMERSGNNKKASGGNDNLAIIRSKALRGSSTNSYDISDGMRCMCW